MSLPNNPQPAPSSESLAVIDYLRGLAALGVALFHVRVDLWVGWRAIQAHPEAYSLLERLLAWVAAPATILGQGVMLFFVISGFCIHFPAATGKPQDWRVYAVRRALRIFPPYLAAVLLTVVVEWILVYYFHQPASPATLVWKSFFMLQNYGDVSGQLMSNPSLWSLPVEVELYLVYPFLLWLMMKFKLRWAWGVTTIFSLAGLLAWYWGWKSATDNFAKYWVLWFAGAWLAQTWRTNTLPAWTQKHKFCLILFLLAASTGSWLLLTAPVLHFVWGAAYFLLVWGALAATKNGLKIPVILACGLLGLGKISYSLYLIHFPVFRLMGACYEKASGHKPANFLIPLAALGIVTGIAWVFYKVIEEPSHRLARSLSKSAPV